MKTRISADCFLTCTIFLFALPPHVHVSVKTHKLESPAMPGRGKSLANGGLLAGQLGRMQPNGD